MSALIDTGQIAAMLNVKPLTVRQYATCADFPAPKEPGKWAREEVCRWLQPVGDISLLMSIELPTREQLAERRLLERLSEATMRDHVSMAVRNARRRSIERARSFPLSAAQIHDLYVAQGGLCAVSGMPFSLDRPVAGAPAPFSPSIDRLDNSRGYEPDNIRLVCYCLNLLMNVWGASVYRKLVEHIEAKAE